MKKLNLLFCNCNSLGHFIPALALAKLFCQRGHQVVFSVLSVCHEIRARLRAEKFDFVYLLAAQYKDEDKNPLPDYQKIVLSLAEVIKKYHVHLIFSGHLFPPAMIAGQLTGTPVVKLFPNPYIYTENGHCPFLSTQKESHFSSQQFLYYQYLNFIRCQFKLPIVATEELIVSPFANILMVAEDVPYLNTRPEEHIFISGPVIERTRKEHADFSFLKCLNQGAKKIFVSLGTEISRRKQSIRFFHKIIKTFSCYQADQLQIMIYLGPWHPCRKQDYPVQDSNCCIIDGFIPQLDLIKLSDLVICHGGWNTVHEALYSGKPVLVFPFEGHQFQTAQWIEKKQLGLQYDFFSFDENELRNHVLQFLLDPKLKKKLELYQADLNNQDRLISLSDAVENRYQSFKIEPLN